MTRVVVEHAPSGTFARASRFDGDVLVVGPSAPTIDAAIAELDRDAGGPQVRARPSLPGEPTFTPRKMQPRVGALVAIALLTGGCATFNEYARKAERYRSEVAAMVLAAEAMDEECQELQEPRPKLCEHVERLLDAAEPGLEVVR